MDLRERKRMASLGNPKMAPKVDKDWQSQLDMIKKNDREY